VTSPGTTLDGKIAFVTGAASGIGVGIAEALAQAGAAIVIADRDHANAMGIVAELTSAGHQAQFTMLDLVDEASIVNAISQTIKSIGTPWILVNNAGIQDRELLSEGTTEMWDRAHAINARAPFLLTRELSRAMISKGDGGRIINIASCVLRGQVIKGLTAYAGSKGSISALTKASSFELAEHAITVNTILPGAVKTTGSMEAQGPSAEGPGRRPGLLAPMCEPKDIGAAVAFFASRAARYITNQEIAVDAGFSIS
jgi:NAD(P)-dependent dehydrogenase (short-subunit alcohol dehydrogenase family)